MYDNVITDYTKSIKIIFENYILRVKNDNLNNWQNLVFTVICY